MMFRCQRKVWKLAGKDIEGFPLNSNIHESGNSQLVSMAPDIFNHREETSKLYYQTFNRGRMVASAKKTYFDLCSPDKDLTAPNRNSSTTSSHVKEKPSIKTHPTEKTPGQSHREPRKSGREKKKPKFLAENFV